MVKKEHGSFTDGETSCRRRKGRKNSPVVGRGGFCVGARSERWRGMEGSTLHANEYACESRRRDENSTVLTTWRRRRGEDKVGRGWDGVACDRVTGRRRRLLTQDSPENRRQNLDIVGDVLRAI